MRRADTTSEGFSQVIGQASYAFEVWKQVPVYKRAALIELIGAVISQHHTKLAEYVSYETGKTIQESHDDVAKALSYIHDTVKQMQAGKLFAYLMLDEQQDRGELTLDIPQGIVGVIAPSNYPIALSIQSVALGLGAGDSVIVKPHEQCGYSDTLMQDVYKAAIEQWNQLYSGYQVPVYLIQSIYSHDAAAGQMLCGSKQVSLLTFVGSSCVGKHIQQVVEARKGKVIIEAGGNAPFIITSSAQQAGHADYPDNFHLQAVDEVIKGAIVACGQRCSTPRRVFVEKGQKQAEILQAFIAAYALLDDEALYSVDPHITKMGPLLTQTAFDLAQVIRCKLQAQEDVAVYGGRPILVNSGGYYMTPMLVMVKQGCQIEEMKRETFAPILYVQEVDNLERCLDKANNTENQLTGGVWTKKPEVVIERLCGKLLVNQLIINGNTSGSGKNYGGFPGVGFIGTDPKVAQFYSAQSTTLIAPIGTIKQKFGLV